MQNRRVFGVVLVVIGVLGFAIFLPLYATQQQTYTGYGPSWGMMGGMMGRYGNVYGNGSQSPYYPGGTGGNGGMGPGMMGPGTITAGQTVTIQQAEQMMHDIPSYAKVVSSSNTIQFDSQNVNVLVLMVMANQVGNLTGRQLQNSAADHVFLIYGLVNPTIVVRRGASVQFTVVNLDDDMYHNLVVSSYGPPYGYMGMQAMMSGNWMPYLPPADYTSGSAREYSYTLNMNQQGTFWYLCTYQDHAEAGMYGQLIVTS